MKLLLFVVTFLWAVSVTIILIIVVASIDMQHSNCEVAKLDYGKVQIAAHQEIRYWMDSQEATYKALKTCNEQFNIAMGIPNE